MVDVPLPTDTIHAGIEEKSLNPEPQLQQEVCPSLYTFTIVVIGGPVGKLRNVHCNPPIVCVYVNIVCCNFRSFNWQRSALFRSICRIWYFCAFLRHCRSSLFSVLRTYQFLYAVSLLHFKPRVTVAAVPEYSLIY